MHGNGLRLTAAISMDSKVLLLGSAREHWGRSHDAHEAAVGGLADA
jgi:hypothetical protein